MRLGKILISSAVFSSFYATAAHDDSHAFLWMRKESKLNLSVAGHDDERKEEFSLSRAKTLTSEEFEALQREKTQGISVRVNPENTVSDDMQCLVLRDSVTNLEITQEGKHRKEELGLTTRYFALLSHPDQKHLAELIKKQSSIKCIQFRECCRFPIDACLQDIVKITWADTVLTPLSIKVGGDGSFVAPE